jgi:uncharacterized protein YraI
MKVITLLAIFLLLFPLPVFSLSAHILAEGVAVRAGPGLEHPLVGEFNLFGTFPILDRQGEWLRIRLIGYTGWIHKQWVTTISVDQDQGMNDYRYWPLDWHIWLDVPFPFRQNR